MTTAERILEARLVAILRGDYSGRWLDYAGALLQGGVSVMEITLNSPGALDGIKEVRAALGDRILLGAGTVLTADEVARAADAGAEFIVAPDTDEAVIEAALARGLVAIPGAFTPTEIKRAYRLGAAVVKLFPAQSPDYLRAVRAPLDAIPLMATGGIDLDNVVAFMAAGANAVGIGSHLVRPGLSPDEVLTRATRFVAAISGKQLA